VRETLNVWMDAAGGRYVDSKVSIFATATKLVGAKVNNDTFWRLRDAAEKASAAGDDVSDATGLVVMPRGKASKLVAETSHWKEIVGKRLPFVMVKDVYQVQSTLRLEYPHAWLAIDLLTRDLRDSKPVRLKPTILVGAPGSGKSRMVRRLAQLLQTSLYRFDASGIADSVAWAGTARGWGNTTPSIPARAVQQAMQANPMILIDEIEKGGNGHHNGNVYSAMTPFLERETAQRLRDISLDAELDLSWVSYVATANDDTTIPSHIRDRFKIVRVPLPTLDHLRPLARNVMADLAAEDDLDPRWMAPLDADEEAVVAKAWTKAGMYDFDTALRGRWHRHKSLFSDRHVTTSLRRTLNLFDWVTRFPELLPFLCFCQPVFRFCLPAFHFLFGKRSPLMAHDFKRYKLTVRIH